MSGIKIELPDDLVKLVKRFVLATVILFVVLFGWANIMLMLLTNSVGNMAAAIEQANEDFCADALTSDFEYIDYTNTINNDLVDAGVEQP